MADGNDSDDRAAESLRNRQRLLTAVLEAFPTEQLHPYGEQSQLYQDLVAAREDPSLAEVQGMLTARWTLVVRRWRRLLDERLRREGETLVRWHALFELSVSKPSETLTSLAARIGVISAALVGLLDELEKDGLIKRTVDENDRRSKLISLTPAGEAAVSSMYDLTAKLREDFLRGVSESEIRLMLDCIERMNRNLDAMNDQR